MGKYKSKRKTIFRNSRSLENLTKSSSRSKTRKGTRTKNRPKRRLSIKYGGSEIERSDCFHLDPLSYHLTEGKCSVFPTAITPFIISKLPKTHTFVSGKPYLGEVCKTSRGHFGPCGAMCSYGDKTITNTTLDLTTGPKDNEYEGTHFWKKIDKKNTSPPSQRRSSASKVTSSNKAVKKVSVSAKPKSPSRSNASTVKPKHPAGVPGWTEKTGEERRDAIARAKSEDFSWFWPE